MFPDVDVEIEKHVRNSWEITIVVNGENVLVWSGLEKGPPRKEKWPIGKDKQWTGLIDLIQNEL